MRIIHGHDYYDSALAYGSDPDVVFVREKHHQLTREQASRIPQLVPHIPYLYFTTKQGTYHSQHGYIPCNGTTAYVSGVSAWVGSKCWHGYKVTCDQVTTVHWSLDSLAKWAQELHMTVVPTNRYWMIVNNKPEIAAGEVSSHPQLQEWMAQNHVTVITHEQDKGMNAWRVNGDNLRDLQLFRVVNAYSMFQMISEWVGGVLPRQGNPMVQIQDDQIKAAKHGFDKWSFRRPPQSKWE